MNFIYITTNLINGKQYVGSHNGTEDDNYLGSGKPAFSNALKKYRKENFKREIIEECDPLMNLLLETKYIKEYNTLVPNGYNISPTGGLRGGGRQSKETKKKIGEANKGNPGPWKGKKRSFSDDHCRKIGESHKGKIVIHTKEAKQKMSESHKGLKHSLETKRKIGEKSVGRRAGCILSPEVKNKISIALKGKKRGPYKKRQ